MNYSISMFSFINELSHGGKVKAEIFITGYSIQSDSRKMLMKIWFHDLSGNLYENMIPELPYYNEKTIYTHIYTIYIGKYIDD